MNTRHSTCRPVCPCIATVFPPCSKPASDMARRRSSGSGSLVPGQESKQGGVPWRAQKFAEAISKSMAMVDNAVVGLTMTSGRRPFVQKGISASRTRQETVPEMPVREAIRIPGLASDEEQRVVVATSFPF